MQSKQYDRDGFNPGSGYSPIMTLQEVAVYLGLHHLTIYRLIQKGKIPAAKVGGSWRFKKDVIDRWIENDMDDHYRRKMEDRNPSSGGTEG